MEYRKSENFDEALFHYDLDQELIKGNIWINNQYDPFTAMLLSKEKKSETIRHFLRHKN